MKATIFEIAFFVLIGLAILGLLVMATVAVVSWVRVVWLWLRTPVTTAKPGHL